MVVGDPISRNPQDTREEEIDRGADQGQMSPTGQVGVIKHGWMGTPPYKQWENHGTILESHGTHIRKYGRLWEISYHSGGLNEKKNNNLSY